MLLPERAIGMNGLKSTAIVRNPTAQEYLPARTAWMTIIRPEAQTTMVNNPWLLATGSCNTARSNMVIETHFITFVILVHPFFVRDSDSMDETWAY
jgi:hypothetical protein